MFPFFHGDSFAALSHIRYELFKRIQQLTGIKLSRLSMRELEASPHTFRMVLSDVKKLSARVKGLNILALAEGNALTIQVCVFGTKMQFHADMHALSSGADFK